MLPGWESKVNPNTALSFDDVLLIPAKSEIQPKDADLHTSLTRNIEMNIPLISAAMDTVTESEMAIAMAQEGGIGIIHRNLSIEDQVLEVNRVKRHESGIIGSPVTIAPDKTLEEAKALMDHYRISGLPVTEDGREKSRLIGILTNRDLRFFEEGDLGKKRVLEVMTRDVYKITENGPVRDLAEYDERARDILVRYKIEKVPLVNRDGGLIGLITYKDLKSHSTHPNAFKDKKGRLAVGAAVGISDLKERVEALIREDVDVVVLDSAHGHTGAVIDGIKYIKHKYDGIDVIAGNVATAKGTMDLIEAGADAVKVGIGPGSICTTRIVSGAGVPQVTAILESAEVARGYGVPIIADGGIRDGSMGEGEGDIQYSGDIAKALAAGASSVMIGMLFAGTDESPGEVVHFQGKLWKGYRGMGSIGAIEDGSDRYGKHLGRAVPEGVEGLVDYKGKLEDAVYQLLGGVRVGMGYCGCRTIPELWQNACFRAVTSSSLGESHPHNIRLTKTAPNYPGLGRQHAS